MHFTVYIATRKVGDPPEIVDFDSEKLPKRAGDPGRAGSGTPLVSYGIPQSQLVRIVDGDTRTECPGAFQSKFPVNSHSFHT